MVNLIAGRQVVPELMQTELTGERLAAETARLLDDAEVREKMKLDLAEVAASLAGDGGNVMQRAADEIEKVLGGLK